MKAVLYRDTMIFFVFLSLMLLIIGALTNPVLRNAGILAFFLSSLLIAIAGKEIDKLEISQSINKTLSSNADLAI